MRNRFVHNEGEANRKKVGEIRGLMLEGMRKKLSHCARQDLKKKCG